MQISPTIAELAKALCKAHRDIKHAARTQENPFFRSKYADLADVKDACRAALTDNGLSFLHTVDSTDGETVTVACMLIHESGEWISCSLTVKPGKARARPQNNQQQQRERSDGDSGDAGTVTLQAIGSAITYARRFTLAAMAGVATEDDDGNGASLPQGPPARQRDVPPGRTKAAEPGNVDRKALGEQVRTWSGVQPEDVPSVMNLLKRRLKIEGKLEEKDYARVSKFVSDMGMKGKSLEDVQADVDAEDQLRGN